MWVADQLDIIANRYLSRNARIIAQQVRDAIVSGDTSLRYILATGSEPLPARNQSKLGLPELPSWPHSAEEMYHGFIANENLTRTASGVDDLQRAKGDESIFHGDPRNWNTGA
jgi:hypothetical protein